MWFSVVCTLINNDMCYHIGQNVVDSWVAAKWVVHNKLTWNWKCMRCIMQMSYLYVSDFPLKILCKLTQYAETIQKMFWAKSNHDAYSLLITVQTAINHILICFFPHNISIKENVFSRAWAEKSIAWHIDTSSVVWNGMDNDKLVNQIVD